MITTPLSHQKTSHILVKVLTHAAGVVVGTAIVPYIGAIANSLHITNYALLEQTVLAKWEFPESIASREYNSWFMLRQPHPSQHELVWESDNSSTVTYSRRAEPLLWRHAAGATWC